MGDQGGAKVERGTGRLDSASKDSPARAPSARARVRAREQRLAERGDRILDALSTLLTRWGYAKTTVDDIAREAGVAKGTVYLHWPTKEAMLLALIDRETQQWSAIIFERMAADPHGGTIAGMYRHALALCAENPVLRALFTLDRGVLGEWTRLPESHERSRRRIAALHGLIAALRDAGLMRTDMTVQVQAYLLWALLYGILTVDEYMPAESVPPPADVADAFAVMVRRGLETEMAESAEARARGYAAIADLMNSLDGATAASGQAQRRPDSGRGGAAEHGAARPDKKEETT